LEKEAAKQHAKAAKTDNGATAAQGSRTATGGNVIIVAGPLDG
jgi:hypothetical protein